LNRAFYFNRRTSRQKPRKERRQLSVPTCFDIYPGYDSEIDVSNGSKAVVVFDDEDLNFKFNIRGLELIVSIVAFTFTVD